MLCFNPNHTVFTKPLNTFQEKVIDFCHGWKSGQNEFLFHTSGSTGSPKPIYLSRTSLINSATMTRDWLHLLEGDNVLMALPVEYIAGAMMLVRALVLNLNLILVEPCQNPLEGLKKDTKIHLASFVTTQWNTILNSKVNLSPIFSQAKGILIGGSEIPNALEFQSKKIPLPIFHTYGMTETASHIAYRSIHEENDIFNSFHQVKIELNKSGCLRINSPSTENKWIETHDLAEILAPDQFRILGRNDFTINSGGRKIQPSKVDKFAKDYFSNVSVEFTLFAIGIQDSFYGQKLVLFVEAENNMFNQEALLAFLKEHLQAWETPKEIILLPNFVYTSLGKIDRPNTLTLYLNNLNT
jgi:O-succinylbenzoic acid--CoA ligase